MRALAILMLFALPALADEADRLIAQAKRLEERAEAALDKGQRPQAFELLARASDLRARARRVRAGEDMGEAKDAPPSAKPQPPKPQPPKPDMPKRMASPRKASAAALKRLDDALAEGDAQAAARAGRELRQTLVRWSRDLDARERKLARRRAGAGVERRLADLERQVRDLRAMLDER